MCLFSPIPYKANRRMHVTLVSNLSLELPFIFQYLTKLAGDMTLKIPSEGQVTLCLPRRTVLPWHRFSLGDLSEHLVRAWQTNQT